AARHRGSSAQAGSAADHAGIIAVDEAADRIREGRVGLTIDLGCVVGGDREGGGGDGQAPVGKGEAIVGGAERALGPGDCVTADAAGGRGRGAQAGSAADYAGVVAVDKAGDRVREGRVSLTIDLGRVAGGYRQDGWVDGERAVSEGKAIVGC